MNRWLTPAICNSGPKTCLIAYKATISFIPIIKKNYKNINTEHYLLIHYFSLNNLDLYKALIFPPFFFFRKEKAGLGALDYFLINDKLWIRIKFWAKKAELSVIMVVYSRGMHACHKKNVFTEWKVRVVAVATLGRAMSIACRKKQVPKPERKKKRYKGKELIKLKEVIKRIKTK